MKRVMHEIDLHDGWTRLGLAASWFGLILTMLLSQALWVICHGAKVTWLHDEMIVEFP